MNRLAGAVQDWLNPPHRLTGRRFDTDSPLAAPGGPYRIAHHAIVIPGLPEPLRYLSVITMFRRPPGRGGAGGTAAVLIGSAAPGTSRVVERDHAASPPGPAGTVFRFGDDIALTGSYPRLRLAGRPPGLGVDLTLTATDVVTNLAALRGGVYEHQSVLCRYRGTVAHGSMVHRVGGLCALEYARGRRAGPPFRRFTYHVVGVDERTQVLFSQILGPARLPLFQGLHVRRLGEGSRTYRNGFVFTPARQAPDRPRGLPARFSVAVADDDGAEVFRIDATAHPDTGRDPAAGHAGSYDYRGTLDGRPVSGTGYGEYVAR